MTQIEKVISGGQVGADVAALRAARGSGVPTGGWCPAGFKTKHGPNKQLLSRYGLREHRSALYPPRTYANVEEADATIRIAVDFDSPGERCTLKAIRKFKKPYLDVQLSYARGKWDYTPSVRKIVKWLRENDVHVLNVAGNANPNIEVLVQVIVMTVLKEVND